MRAVDQPPRQPGHTFLILLAMTLSVDGCSCSPELTTADEIDQDAGSDLVSEDALDTEGDDGDEVRDDDEFCHIDCFGYTECNEGVVTAWLHTPVPCEYWEGECPNQTVGTCARGCRVDGERADPYEDPMSVCEENRPKRVGDPCEDDSWCQPTSSTVDAANTVYNLYLRCDEESGSCLETSPPVIDNYLSHCGLTNADANFSTPSSQVPGYAAAESCPSGLCIVRQSSDCLRQGCTIQCDSATECPQGSTCEAGYRNRGFEPVTVRRGICKPGPLGRMGPGLTCSP